MSLLLSFIAHLNVLLRHKLQTDMTHSFHVVENIDNQNTRLYASNRHQ